MDGLFDRITDFHGACFRNIVSLRQSKHLFDDLIDEEELASFDLSNAIAVKTEAAIKKDIPCGKNERGFYYNTAIGYPFETQNFMSTRFSDGTYGTWYGSLELATTIYETTYHMLQNELAIEGNYGTIIREREVYTVHCDAILIDLRNKQYEYPELIADNYEYTHAIGARLVRERHPGLITPSARYEGDNLVIFNNEILSKPVINCYLTYKMNLMNKTTVVEKHIGKPYLMIDHAPVKEVC